MSWLLLSGTPVAAPLHAALDDGRWLLGWPDERRPHPAARRCDPRLLDPAGAPAEVSLLWPDRDALPPFDDPAVMQARRLALAGPWPRAASALTVDPVHFAGSVWVGTGAADPFRLIGHPAVLRVGAGLFGSFARPTGPAIERYAGAPWPGGAFS